MKGVTPIIAIIILLLITISLAGVAYTYLSGYFTGATAKVIQLRDSVKNIALINNIGSQPVNTQTNLVVLVNGIESEILTNELIEPGKSVNLEYVPAVFGNSLNVRIRGPSNFISFITDIPTLTYTAQDEFETFSDGRRCSEDLNSLANSQLTLFTARPVIFIPTVIGNCYSGSAGSDNTPGASPMRVWAAGTDASNYSINNTGINSSVFKVDTGSIATFSFSDINRVSRTDQTLTYVGDVNFNLEPTVTYSVMPDKTYVRVQYSVRNTGASPINVRLFSDVDTNNMGTTHFQSGFEGSTDTTIRTNQNENWSAHWNSSHTDVIGFIGPPGGEVDMPGNGVVIIEERASTSLPAGQSHEMVFYIVADNQGSTAWTPVRNAYNEIFGIVCTDNDLDTYTTCATPTADCNDGNAAISPGATEVCDNVDNNCVNGIDEGFDADSDTYTTCETPTPDCNDGNAGINPGAAEVCTDSIDNNCNTQTDCADSACSSHPSCVPSANVQSGAVTLGFNINYTIVMINEINTSSAFLVFSTSLDSGVAESSNILGQVVNSTALNFSRVGSYAGSPAITVKWYVANFTSGVYVQRGSRTMSSTFVNTAINSVNLTRSFPIISMQSQVAYSCRAFSRAKLTSNTNLQLYVGCAASDSLIQWQVIEFANAVVQSGDITFDSTTPSLTVPVTSINTAKSWLFYTINSTAASSGNIGQKLIRGLVTNQTTLTFDRDATGVGWTLTWYLVEFTDATSVQHASQNFATTETQRDITITSVDLTRTIATAGSLYYRGGKTSNTAANPGSGTVTLDLTSPTNLRLTRASTASSTADIGWFVVQF